MTVAILLRRAQARPGQNDDEVLGPCERGALTTGLRLAAGLGTDAVAIAVGPARREDRVLAMALRAGCARAVRVGGEGLDDLDYLGVAEILAGAVTRIGADVVTCGDRSLDERVGAMGPAVAELLDFAHLTSVATASAAAEQPLTCERLAGRHRQRVTLRAPAVLCTLPPAIGGETALDGSGRSRGAPGTIDVLDTAELGLDLRQLSPRKGAAGRLRAIRTARQATILATAAELVDRLAADHLLSRDEARSGS